MSVIRETIKDVVGQLLEGRLEDVKAKYGEDMSNIIDDLSQNDPSGNNKYLAWMAKAYKEDNSQLNQIIKAVGEFHKGVKKLNTNFTTPIVDSNKDVFPGRAERRVKNNPKDINSFPSLKSLTLITDVLAEMTPIRDDRDKIYQDEKYTVIVPKTREASCKYGVHSNWCVSTSNSGYFDSYTKNRGALLFFVLWRNKYDTDDVVEYKMAANPKYDQWNNPSVWQWYSKKDRSIEGDLALNIFPPNLISSIQNYLKDEGFKKGVLFDVESKVREVMETEDIIAQNSDFVFFKTDDFRKYYSMPSYRNAEPYDIRRGGENETNYMMGMNKKTGHLQFKRVGNISHERQYKNWIGSRSKDIDYAQYALGFNNMGDMNIKPELINSIESEATRVLSQRGGEWFRVQGNTLVIGDKIRWKKGRGYWQQRNAMWNEATIDRQTPAGFFVTAPTEEFPKGKRFKPTSNWMDKWVDYDNINLKKH
jgi:hypothetical protein